MRITGEYLAKVAVFEAMADYESDPNFLRFCVIDSTMRFLFYSYHLAVNFPTKR